MMNKEIESALEILNFYRNLHYADSSGTEEKELADAINVVLPRFCKMMEETK